MPRKLTHEEYVERVKNINSNIEVIGTYINSTLPILHKCKIDDYEWEARPNTILNGGGCPKCGGNVRKTQEEYIREVLEINPNIEIVGKYIGANSKILHRCKTDGYEWYATPSNILKGIGCPKCSGKNKKTHEEYVTEVSDINPNIEVVGKYINNHTNILHRCKIDGCEWMASPHNILRGRRCPRCTKKEKYDHKEYVSRVARINQDIEVVGKYVNATTKILHKCKIDGFKWYTTPHNILQGKGCPDCARKKLRNKLVKSHDKYVDELLIINRNIKVIGQYVNSQTPITHKCLICDCEWEASPSNTLKGVGCPNCGSCNSIGEKAISDWFEEYNFSFQRQKTFDDCKDKIKLRFDFYLPDYNILIEYNGRQHYEPIEYFGGQKAFETQVLRDKIKKEYCQKNNILLFEIPYYSDLREELVKLYEIIQTKNIEKEVVA